MTYRAAFASLLLASSLAAVAQEGKTPAKLPAQTTLPVLFTSTVSAETAHAGDTVFAKTIQTVLLENGLTIPSGARVLGHVVEATPFVYDKAPYAKQKQSSLTIHFDSVQLAATQMPLRITVRALADVFATDAAYEPKSSDLDPLGTRTLIGGNYLIPSQNEVRNLDGDVVAYNRRDGVYAHLIANGRCDGSLTEASMGVFAASACGVYGYTNVNAADLGSEESPSTLTLVSHRTSPKIWKHSAALLEVLPQEQAFSGR